jgi:hypothetical protein
MTQPQAYIVASLLLSSPLFLIPFPLTGPSNDHEMYVRWVQWASYSAVFRSHDRGMSAGDCANTHPSACR